MFMPENAKRGGLAWSAVVILDGANTRPFRRYTTLDLAVAAAESEPEMRSAPDYLIIHPKSVMGSLEPEELAALVLLTGEDDASQTTAQRQERVRQWLGKLDPLYDALSDEATKTPTGAAAMKATAPAATKSTTPNEDDMATKKKGKKGAAKKAAPKVKKKAAAKPAAKKQAGDGLGREGSVTRFICEGILAKVDDKKLLEQARKKFPDRKVSDYYVSWYRRKLRIAGLLKK
jgi:hypothetical protein